MFSALRHNHLCFGKYSSALFREMRGTVIHIYRVRYGIALWSASKSLIMNYFSALLAIHSVQGHTQIKK
jgi:hypothetical protein